MNLKNNITYVNKEVIKMFKQYTGIQYMAIDIANHFGDGIGIVTGKQIGRAHV